MITHIHYFQEKKVKHKDIASTCELRVGSDDNSIVFASNFLSEYFRVSQRNSIGFSHELKIDKSTGDLSITYKIENGGRISARAFKSGVWTKKNDFRKLDDLCDRGFYTGEKRINFWGIKYKRITDKIFDLIKTELLENVDSDYIRNKNYEKYVVSPLFDLLVDYHLTKKGIKFHDNVYNHIQQEYPKKKWLKLNDNKFLSAVLDGYGIKSKYLISELSQDGNVKVNIKCVKYLCNLFGENYLDYIKKFPWETISSIHFNPPKKHSCKNESEKIALANVLSKWNDGNELRLDNPLELVYELLSIRSFLEERGHELKLKIRKANDVDFLTEEWLLIKKHLSLGYKLKYNIPDEIISEIEEPIEINDKVYTPKLILSEDEFIIESIKMKNCMSKQFMHGAIYLFVSMSCKSKRINLQYRKGSLVQHYGKANTPVNKELFDDAVEILTKRMSKFSTLEWKKEKYEIITD